MLVLSEEDGREKKGGVMSDRIKRDYEGEKGTMNEFFESGARNLNSQERGTKR